MVDCLDNVTVLGNCVFLIAIREGTILDCLFCFF